MPIYRIRRIWGNKGGANHYSHADIIARNHALALNAATQGRVHNWRHIDEFDQASESYEKYELLGRIDSESAKDPDWPTPWSIYLLENKVKKIPGVVAATLHARIAVVVLKPHVRRLRHEVNNFLAHNFPGKIRFYYSR